MMNTTDRIKVGDRVTFKPAGKCARLEGMAGKVVSATVREVGSPIDPNDIGVIADYRLEPGAVFAGMGFSGSRESHLDGERGARLTIEFYRGGRAVGLGPLPNIRTKGNTMARFKINRSTRPGCFVHSVVEAPTGRYEIHSSIMEAVRWFRGFGFDLDAQTIVLWALETAAHRRAA